MVTRLYDFTNGSVADADQVDAELNQLVNELNANVILTTGAQTKAGVLTLSSAPVISTITNTGTLTLPTSTDTLVGRATTDTLTNKTLTKPVINGTNPTGATYTPATGAQTVALDCATNNMHIVTGHADGTAITFTIANITNNQAILISITQGAVVSTITAWFATIRWAGGSAPTLTATINKRDVFIIIRTGENLYDGFIAGQNL